MSFTIIAVTILQLLYYQKMRLFLILKKIAQILQNKYLMTLSTNRENILCNFMKKLIESP